jgi:hypothetical protein
LGYRRGSILGCRFDLFDSFFPSVIHHRQQEVMLMVEKIKKKSASTAKSSFGLTLETPPGNATVQNPSVVKPAKPQARSGVSTNPRIYRFRLKAVFGK